MIPQDEELDHRLIDLLEQLRPVPDRDAEKAALGRANYLSEVKVLAQTKSLSLPVSGTLPQRLKGWINSIRTSPQRKERFSMLATLTTLVLAFALLFGGAGATVYAAQDSLPADFLYPVKTLSENVQLGLAANAENQLELALKFANRRALEAVSLAVRGEPIPEGVAARSQQEMNLALQLAAGQDDAPMQQALEQIQASIRRQEQIMTRLQAQNPGLADPVLAQLQTQLREQARLAELGLSEPQNFRMQIRQQMQSGPGAPLNTTPEPPGTGSGFGPGPGPYTGTQSCPNCTPALDGSGPGPGPMNQGTTSTPGSGSGGPGMGPGSGTGDCQGCTPVQDGSGPGSANTPEPQPTSGPGGGGPGGGSPGGGGLPGGGGMPGGGSGSSGGGMP
jgi:hypothetical protein